MNIAVHVLDVWRQGNDRRLILRNDHSDNLFRIHSPGTGELIRKNLFADEVLEYLAGNNPDEWPYLYENNVGKLLEEAFPSYGPLARTLVGVIKPDADLLAKMEEERRRQYRLDNP